MKAAYKYDILENHTDNEVSISRTKTEEIRNNPFGLVNAVKGLTNMNHERNLSNYAENLVICYAKFKHGQYYLSLQDLTVEDQNELVRLYIEKAGRDTSECVHGTDFAIDNEYTCALLAMLKDNCEETREKFAEVTRKNIHAYYEETLEEILNVACDDYLNNINNEAGYYARQDQGNGETYWSHL